MARIVTLVRRSKKREHSGWYDCKLRRPRDLPTGGFRIFLESSAARPVPTVRQVKRERLEFLSDKPLYTKRFAF
jgi:hypothetical protein